MEILLRALTLAGLALLVMCVVGLARAARVGSPPQPVVGSTGLNVLTVWNAWLVLLGVIVASVSPRLHDDAGTMAVICGLVVSGATLARFRPIRGAGYVLLGVAALLATVRIAQWFGWDGLNMHMN